MIPAGEGHDLAEGWPIPEQLQALPSLETKPTYYSEALRLYLLQRSNILGDTEQDRANMLYRGGLAIPTTLDPRLQGLAEEARTKLPANKAGIDAAIALEDRQQIMLTATEDHREAMTAFVEKRTATYHGR